MERRGRRSRRARAKTTGAVMRQIRIVRGPAIRRLQRRRDGIAPVPRVRPFERSVPRQAGSVATRASAGAIT